MIQLLDFVTGNREFLCYNPDEDVFYVTAKGNDSSRTVTADDFTGSAVDETVKEKYARQEDVSKDLQYNKLTPRVSKYLEFLQNCTFSMESFAGPRRDISLSAWDLNEITTRLYDLGQMGKPALYLWHKHEDNPAVEGFFAVLGEEVICLATADHGGGSGGGETACLWYDSEEDRLLPGRTSYYGGGVFGSGGDIYDLIDGECQNKISWIVFDHGDPEGGEMTFTYYVNEEMTTVEQYKEVRRRYTRVDILR